MRPIVLVFCGLFFIHVARADDGYTDNDRGLMQAAIESDEEAACWHIARGADVNTNANTKSKAKLDGYLNLTPLITAAMSGHAGVVYILLQSDDIEINRTLHLSTDLVKLAANTKSNAHLDRLMEFDQYTALMFAAYNGHRDVVRILMEDPRTSTDHITELGETAESIAKSNGHYMIADMVSNANRRPVAQSNKGLISPIRRVLRKGALNKSVCEQVLEGNFNAFAVWLLRHPNYY